MRPLPLSLLSIAALSAGLSGCKEAEDNSQAASQASQASQSSQSVQVAPQAAQMKLKPLLIPVCLNSYCGLLDQDGKVLQDFTETSLNATHNLDNYFKVVNNQWVILAADGSKITDFAFEMRYLKGGVYGAKLENGKYKLMASSGKALTEALYDELNGNFFGEYLVYEQNGKSGVMDKTGKAITAAQYDEIDAFSSEKSAADTLDFVLAKKGKQQWLINTKTGQQVRPTFDWLSTQNDNLMVVFNTNKAHSNGLLDRNGKLVIAQKYEKLGLPANGLIAATEPDAKQCGYLDYQGKTVIPPQFAECQPFGKTAALAKEQGVTGKWGVIGRDGHWLQTPKWEYANGAAYDSTIFYTQSPGKAVAYDSDGFSGRAKNSALIDTDSGKTLFSGAQYQVLGLLGNAFVFSTGKEKEATYSMGDSSTPMPGLSVMDAAGKVLIPSEGFLEINPDATGQYWLASHGKNLSVFTTAAKRLFSTPWASVQARPDLGIFLALGEDAYLNPRDNSPNVSNIKGMYALDGSQRFVVKKTPCGAEQLFGPDNKVIWPKDPNLFCPKAE